MNLFIKVCYHFILLINIHDKKFLVRLVFSKCYISFFFWKRECKFTWYAKESKKVELTFKSYKGIFNTY